VQTSLNPFKFAAQGDLKAAGWKQQDLDPPTTASPAGAVTASQGERTRGSEVRAPPLLITRLHYY